MDIHLILWILNGILLLMHIVVWVIEWLCR